MSPDLAYQAYKSAHYTVAKTRQIVMLYDGAIRYIQRAQHAIAERKIEERYNLLAKASEILAGLSNSIDFDKGGAVALALHDYYGALERRIQRIQFDNNAAACDEVIAQLKEMRDAWDKIDQDSAASSESSSNNAVQNTTQAPASNTPPSVTISA